MGVGNAPLLTLDAISHTFSNGQVGLRGISCTIAAGEYIVITGQNGAGKSLLAEHLCGLHAPTVGAIHIRDATQPATAHELRMLCGMVFQQAEHQIVGQSVIEDVLFGLRNMGIAAEPARESALAQLAQLNIAHLAARHPENLSGGELRRVALAAMLVMKPRILILDEPFAHLDWIGIDNLQQIIRALWSAGHTIVLLTHELYKMPTEAQRVIILHHGEIHTDAPPDTCRAAAQQLGLLPPAGAPSL